MNRGYVFIALATLFFSTMEIALKSIAGEFHPVQINFTRFLIGGLVLLPFARRGLREHGAKLDGGLLATFAFLGFVGIVVSMTFYQFAVENANASVVAVLFSCNPVFVFLFAYLILRADIRRQHVIALILECLGAAILINPLHTDISMAGIVLSALATITFALYAVLGTRPCARCSGVVVTCGSFLFASLEMLVLILLSHVGAVADLFMANGLGLFANIPVFSGYSLSNILTMLYICVGVTGGGYACYFMAIEATSALTASLVFFFKPALAPILALIFLREPIPINMVVGIILILLGSLISLIPALSVLPSLLVGRFWRWRGIDR